MVFQDPYTSLDPRMRIGQQVEEPLKVHGICSSKEERPLSTSGRSGSTSFRS
jgi:ABC-type microcin C transport system duplicated ATPase subunit YejF